AHFLEHPFIVLAAEKALERREGAIQEQLDVAELAVGQVPRGVIPRTLLFVLGRGLAQVEVLEHAAVRFLECTHRHMSFRQVLMSPRGARYENGAPGGAPIVGRQAARPQPAPYPLRIAPWGRIQSEGDVVVEVLR